MTVSITFSHDDTINGLWTGVGRPMTAYEVDRDLYNIKTAVETLQGNYSATISIDTVTQPTLSTMRVTLTDATFFDLSLPVGSFRDRGDWAVSTPYLVNDTFNAPDGGLYRVIFDHTSSATSFSPSANDGAGHDYYAAMLSSPGNSLPAGGATSMVVEKASGTDFDYRLGYKLPTSGTARQYLIKQSSTNQDAVWDDPVASDIAFSPSTASGLSSINVADALEELATSSGASSLAALTDVAFAIGDPQLGAVLYFNGTDWVAGASPSDGDMLSWDGSDWVPGALSLTTEQLRNPHVEALGSLSGSVTLVLSAGDLFTLTPTGNVTLSASSPAAGAEITLIITTSGTSSFNITPAGIIKSQGVLATGSVTAKTFAMKFVCDGTSLIEVSRTTAM